ncbi:NAD-dependent formate dehydrogenase catalytic subunit /NAD-dependent formate dehydrogenase iron-sulfur protein [Tibeticola sediminis]|uniref:NAD-dependent formate dehydrogenase catalytic subunit /NAD-dependent formate dehydrogenase iron-sulfur protein n=1 Tax=Tibeticola sediminis TaxID=1917811 RepID=A0A3N4UZB6_9BURK|nr:formate dehydrogenase subunit alpha [Tibeticola sediminis]RPE72971.1 NAD-dependent formate dehydrogenase catalytic subunit /NAD-dependent formate dehydrogenase iron-sulfur protein [Tibeticola sediminis]
MKPLPDTEAPVRAAFSFELDGRAIDALEGETILEAAARHGVAIPHLCHRDGLRPEGNCRACVVEIEGERVLAPSCCRSPQPGMKVRAQSPRARQSQQMVLELLLADLPPAERAPALLPTWGELGHWAERWQVAPRPALTALARAPVAPDTSHPAIAVRLDACIQCTRCVRACREVQGNEVIGFAGRGAEARIVFDLDDALGESRCVACGECVQVCPTGALLPARAAAGTGARRVDTLCPYCGVGCRIRVAVEGETIVAVEGAMGPANEGRLCVKGRFGWDYAHSPERLTRPLIRKPGAPKDPAAIRRGLDWREVFREASWDEALDLAAAGFLRLRAQHGPQTLAGFGSAKGTNEEAYLFQKLVRTGFGTHNVDHCTRLCHASSVAALLEGLGSGAVSNPVRDVAHADFILVIGANPASNHPVAATWIKNAVARGARLVVADPRHTDLALHAWRELRFKPDTDLALLNALLHVIVTEGLVNESFVRARTEGYEALVEHLRDYSPERMAPLCGIAADTLREVARAYASAQAAMIFWGMGITQHVHGTDNVRCLIALAALTGHIGRPGTGLHPLRGQNNVQGASDAGLIPMMLPNYQRVADPEVRDWFSRFWGVPLSDVPGLTVVEILNAALAAEADPQRIRGMLIMGENPAMSDPDLAHARAALARLEHLVVQDAFLTETAWLADVVLPASTWFEKTGTATNTDRTVQLGRQVRTPPGEARADLWILQRVAERLGLQWDYEKKSNTAPDDAGYYGVERIYEEMRQTMAAAIGGISWARLEQEGSVTYPCVSADDPGQPVVFRERFPTPSGRLKLVPAALSPAAERPDADYPYVLITGRQLEHWHTGAMTRRSAVLDALEPGPTASLCGADMAALGLVPGERVSVRSRRGEIQLPVRQDDGTPRGAVFIPFAYVEAAANLLTNPALDPLGKIPEVKYCAVQLSRVPSRSA